MYCGMWRELCAEVRLSARAVRACRCGSRARPWYRAVRPRGRGDTHTLTHLHAYTSGHRSRKFPCPSRAGYFCVLCGVAVTWEKEKTDCCSRHKHSKKCAFEFIGVIVTLLREKWAGRVRWRCPLRLYTWVAEGSTPRPSHPQKL